MWWENTSQHPRVFFFFGHILAENRYTWLLAWRGVLHSAKIHGLKRPHSHHVPIDSPPFPDNYACISLCQFCSSLEGSVTKYEQVACLLLAHLGVWPHSPHLYNRYTSALHTYRKRFLEWFKDDVCVTRLRKKEVRLTSMSSFFLQETLSGRGAEIRQVLARVPLNQQGKNDTISTFHSLLARNLFSFIFQGSL